MLQEEEDEKKMEKNDRFEDRTQDLIRRLVKDT